MYLSYFKWSYLLFNKDEIPLLDAIISEEADEEGYGLVAVRRAEYDDSPEIEKKLQEMLFVPSSSQSMLF